MGQTKEQRVYLGQHDLVEAHQKLFGSTGHQVGKPAPPILARGCRDKLNAGMTKEQLNQFSSGITGGPQDGDSMHGARFPTGLKSPFENGQPMLSAETERQQWFQTIVHFFEREIAFDAFLGLRVEHVEEGHGRLHLPYRKDYLGDPFRPALHGGIIAVMVDTAAGVAALSSLPPGSKCSTVDMRVDYLLPGLADDLWAEARVVRSGNRVAVINVEVSQRDHRLVAAGRAVYSLRPAENVRPDAASTVPD